MYVEALSSLTRLEHLTISCVYSYGSEAAHFQRWKGLVKLEKLSISNYVKGIENPEWFILDAIIKWCALSKLSILASAYSPMDKIYEFIRINLRLAEFTHFPLQISPRTVISAVIRANIYDTAQIAQ